MARLASGAKCHYGAWPGKIGKPAKPKRDGQGKGKLDCVNVSAN